MNPYLSEEMAHIKGWERDRLAQQLARYPREGTRRKREHLAYIWRMLSSVWRLGFGTNHARHVGDR
jgi:hypothetical protein